jgi:hypothetical protein
MLSAEEHPGVFTFLVGIIVLVMTGVGLSLLVDRRLKFSSGVVKIQREIRQDAMELEHLTALHDERSRILKKSGSKPQPGAGGGRLLAEELKAMDRRQVALMEMRGQLRKALASQDGGFSFYRADYRRKTWLAAVGENLGNLKVRNGREYLQATITRVTDVGLEIRHEDGIARIQAPDLDSRLQDRFQWKDEERRKVLEKERDHLEGKPGKPGVSDS